MHVRTVWRIVAAAALAVGAALAPGSAPAARAEDTPIERTPEFRKRVETAIAKGVAWNRTMQARDGAFGERALMYDESLVLLTLRQCGVPASDPVRTKGHERLRARYPALPKGRDPKEFFTDFHALTCLALASHAADAAGPGGAIEPADMAVIANAADLLVKTQRADGAWGFILSGDREKSTSAAVPLAVAALQAAQRAGVAVPSTVWTRALKQLLGSQDRKGEAVKPPPGTKAAGPAVRARGWYFSDPSPGSANANDTANALAAVSICRREVSRSPTDAAAAADPKLDAAVRDGLAWLGQNADALGDLADAGRNIVERELETAKCIESAAGALGVERIGSLDWYGAAAEAVLSRQSVDGAWHRSKKPEERDGVDGSLRHTCHALAFLARATPRQPVEAAPAAGDAEIRFDAAPKLPEKEFADFVDRVLTRWRAADAAAKDQIASKLTAVGPRIVAPLVLRLASDDAEVRASAIALLKRATGLDHGFDPVSAADARAAAVLRWQAWTKEHAATLHYDAAAGRIVP